MGGQVGKVPMVYQGDNIGRGTTSNLAAGVVEIAEGAVEGVDNSDPGLIMRIRRLRMVGIVVEEQCK